MWALKHRYGGEALAEASIIALDVAENVFQAHDVGADGCVAPQAVARPTAEVHGSAEARTGRCCSWSLGDAVRLVVEVIKHHREPGSLRLFHGRR